MVTLGLIGVTVALATAASEFFNPARLVLVGDVVPVEQHGRAAGYLQATSATGAIIGPPLAAPLAVGLGVPWALGANALSFLFSYAMIRMIRVPPRETEPTPSAPQRSGGIRREFLAGLRQVRTNRTIMAVLVTSVLIMLGAGAVNALDVYFVSENLHASPAWFGGLGGAFGVGALVGALAAGGLSDRVGPTKVFCAGLLAASTLFLVYSRMSSIWPAVVGLGAVNTVATPLILKVVPREFLGRVASVFGPAAQVSSIISIALAGAIVGSLPLGFRLTVAGIGFGRIDAVFAVSATLMLLGAGYAVIALRGADKEHLSLHRTHTAAQPKHPEDPARVGA
jgi:MFS family permease